MVSKLTRSKYDQPRKSTVGQVPLGCFLVELVHAPLVAVFPFFRQRVRDEKKLFFFKKRFSCACILFAMLGKVSKLQFFYPWPLEMDFCHIRRLAIESIDFSGSCKGW